MFRCSSLMQKIVECRAFPVQVMQPEKRAKEKKGESNSIQKKGKSFVSKKEKTRVRKTCTYSHSYDDDISFGICWVRCHHITILAHSHQHGVIFEVNCTVIVVGSMETGDVLCNTGWLLVCHVIGI